MVELSNMFGSPEQHRVGDHRADKDVSGSALWMSTKFSGWLQCATAYLFGIKNSPTGMGVWASSGSEASIAMAAAAPPACMAATSYITHTLISKTLAITVH